MTQTFQVRDRTRSLVCEDKRLIQRARMADRVGLSHTTKLDVTYSASKNM